MWLPGVWECRDSGVGASLGATRRESAGLDDGVRRSASGGGEVAR